MSDKPTRPDLKTFLSDPAYQGDRDLLEGVIENFLTRKAEETRKKKEEDDAKQPKNIFDRMFGSS